MKKFYFLVFFCLLSLSFGQSVQLYNPDSGVSYPAENYFCAGEKFNLRVDAVASSTGDYAMTGVSASDYGLSAGSIPIIFPSSGSNNFSEAFPIGFNFSFYGKTYTEVVMGSNGRLVFTNDPALENLKNNAIYTDRTFSGVTGYNSYSKLPSTDYNKILSGSQTQELNLAQIFFGYTDFVPRSANGSVTYLHKNVVVSGVNGLIVSFQNQIRTDGLGGISSARYNSNVLLLEDGRVIIYVNDKSEVNYNAILGIQNDDASKSKIPDHSTNAYDYNNGPWTSEGKAWLFTPNQNLTPVFKWTNNGNPVGTNSNTLNNFAPANNDVLKVEVTYLEDSSIIATDQVKFKKIITPIIEGTLNCAYDMKVNDATFDSNLLYTWYRVGEASPVGSGRNLSLDRRGSVIGDYYVKISNSDGSALCPGSNESNRLNFSKQVFPALVKNSYCLTDNTLTAPASKTINLYDQFYPKYDAASGLEPYKILFYTNAGVVSDAEAANFVVPANTELNLRFAVQEITGTYTCYEGGLTLYYLSMPPTKTISLCASVTTYNLRAVFQNPACPLAYAYYYTYVDDGSIADRDAIDVTRSVNIKTSAANCSTNTVVNFVLGATVTLPTVPGQERCAGNDTNANRFDFNLIKSTLDPTNQYDIKFYTKSTDQEIIPTAGVSTTIPNLNLAGYFWSAINGDYEIYAKVIDRADPSCFSVSNGVLLRVYTKPRLQVPNPISLKNCSGNTVFNLSQDPSTISNAGSGITVKLEYYSGSNVLLSNAEVMQYDASALGMAPYLKVIYNISCSDIVNFDLAYHPKPAADDSTPILICAERNYSLQDFKNKVSLIPSQYTFTDFLRNTLPANFDLSILPLTVKFLMKDNTTGCISDEQTVTFVKGTDSILLATETDYELCDTDFDGKTAFKLDSKKSVFTNDASAVFEYFKDANLTQSINSNYTNETAFAQTVFVRITIPGFCPSTAKINLKVNTPTKSSTLEDKYFICFGQKLTIDAGHENTVFDWSNGQTGQTAIFTETGTYSVTLKKGIDGCPYTHNFTISDENQPKIVTINQNNNSIEVLAEGGVKPYLYYFNGVPQSDKTLLNPSESVYEIKVESATGCFGPPKSVYFIKINNAFTPNGDGKNDFWKIENLDKMEKVSIVIVDRNGTKVFESTNPSKVEWDGKHNGRALPSSTYWYVISWYDSVTQKTEQRQGWILIKNRN